MLRFIDLETPSNQEEEPVAPSTKGLQYPEDSMPASDFNGGKGVDPTYLPMMRQEYMQSPEGGITRLPNFEQGPAQGSYTPVKNDGGRYMPEGKEPGVPAPMPVRLASKS